MGQAHRRAWPRRCLVECDYQPERHPDGKGGSMLKEIGTVRPPHQMGEGPFDGLVLSGVVSQGGAQLAGACLAACRAGFTAAIGLAPARGGLLSAWLCRERLLTQFFHPPRAGASRSLCGPVDGSCAAQFLDLPPETGRLNLAALLALATTDRLAQQ